MPPALALHLLSAIIWVGGMFFAYMILRPAAVEVLPPPQRLQLWSNVFSRFFPWVWLAIGLLLASGLWMIFMGYGGMGNVRPYIHIMLLLGLIMMAIFGHVYFAVFRRLRQLVSAEQWEPAGIQLGVIRKLIAVNLSLGLIVVLVAGIGRYW